MKKFAKMSLVAALAVAGTAASAQPLAEAIKNVDVSGTVVYRYDDKNFDEDATGAANGSTATTNHYKIGVSLKSKVTDDVAFNSRFTVNQGFAGFNTQDAADQTVGVELTQANFAYTGIANTTVVVGKQGLATPWTKAIDSDGSEQTGTGILASTTFGPVTAAAGYFNQHNIGTKSINNATEAGTSAALGYTNVNKGSDNIVVAALLGSFGPVNAQAWYLDLDDTLDSYFVKVDGKVGPVSAYIQYQDTDLDDAKSYDVNLLKANISANIGIFNAGVTYARGGDEGTGIMNAVSTNSAIGYTVNTAGKADAQAYFIDLGAQVTDKLHVGLNYDVVEADTSIANSKELDHKEYFVQVTYKHASNLSAYVRLAKGEDEFTSATNNAGDEDEGDYTRGRLQVEYKF